jgi:uncharacterized protein YgiM (DUF1202 family)|tara:strand:+ start:144 stop:803 length:660 start_codon:yes stop_codon:yes gene_type:complete
MSLKKKNNGCLFFIFIIGVWGLSILLKDDTVLFKHETLSGGKVMYSKTDLNVRSEPSIDGKKLLTLITNQKVIVSETDKSGWVFIGDTDSVGLGFVSKKYLMIDMYSKEYLDVLNEQKSDAQHFESFKRNIEKQFSELYGYHKKLKNHTKSNLKDPGSFEHIETTYWKPYNGRVITNYISYRVRMVYTATNSFGGRVRGNVLAEISVDNGDVIQIISSE